MDTTLINQIVITQKFRAILKEPSPVKILRIEGDENMGKSRLLREFRQIAHEEFGAECAIIPSPYLSKTHEDLFEFIGQQTNIKFVNYHQLHNSLADDTLINISGITQLLSIIQVRKDSTKRTQERVRRELTQAFIEDLRLSPESHLVLMFDAFERADADTQEWVNHKIVTFFSSLPNITIVLTGRHLPKPLGIWEDKSITYRLESPTIEDYREFCKKTKGALEEPVLNAFYLVFEGKPGKFLPSYFVYKGQQ